MRWALLATLSVLLAPTPAQACSCGTSSPTELVSEADVVLVGRVNQVERAAGPSEGSLRIGAFRASLQRVLVLKGRGVREMTALWTLDTGCAAKLEAGRSYVALAMRDGEGRVWTDMCSGYAPLGLLLAAVGGLLGVITFLSVVWALRRQRRRLQVEEA